MRLQDRDRMPVKAAGRWMTGSAMALLALWVTGLLAYQ